MLTIISWIVFVPALFWNILFFGIVLEQVLTEKPVISMRNILDSLLSLALLFIPGVYLFGLF